MSRVYCAIAGAALALAGCSSSGTPDYMASAPSVETPKPIKFSGRDTLDARISHYASTHHIPESLVHAAVKRESGYNPGAKNGPYFGLMQIRYSTAHSMGYNGAPGGLLDAETNLKYAVPYLANAYRVANGDERKALRLYASGFYYQAKRGGLLGEMVTALSDSPKIEVAPKFDTASAFRAGEAGKSEPAAKADTASVAIRQAAAEQPAASAPVLAAADQSVPALAYVNSEASAPAQQ